MPRIGVVGTLVWDEIHGRDPTAAPVEEWGGIAYALAGLDASLPPDWEFVPLIKVGRDLSREAERLLQTFRRLTPGGRCVEVPARNNRVVLHYQTAERRCERMSGGVPGWTWAELGPMVRDLDALYLNFISGFELELATARALRQGFAGPIYADLHSLMLGLRQDGIRVPQPLPEAPAWFSCFDVLQMNEEEMDQLGGDPLAVAAQAIGAGVSLLVVTVGVQGVVYVAAPGFQRLADRGRPAAGTAVTTGRIPAEPGEGLDPTGCGDVFGATAAARLLAGDDVMTSLKAASRLAARNAAFRGASGLAAHLRGELIGVN